MHWNRHWEQAEGAYPVAAANSKETNIPIRHCFRNESTKIIANVT
jgi:hypothetical protein